MVPAHVHVAKLTKVEMKKKALEVKVSRLHVQIELRQQECELRQQECDRVQRDLESMKKLFVKKDTVVKFFDFDPNESYFIPYARTDNGSRIRIQISIAHHNVALWLKMDECDDSGNEVVTETVEICLFYPGDAAKNKLTVLSATLEKASLVKGWSNWMKGEEFEEYVQDGRFAIGVISNPILTL